MGLRTAVRGAARLGVFTGSNAPDFAPVNRVAPTISGAAESGATLTVDPGDWSGAATFNYTFYQVAHPEVVADQADDPTYVVPVEWEGETVAALVAATNRAGNKSTTVATSDDVGPILAP